MVISISGNLNKDNLFKIVEEKFSEIKNGNKLKKINSDWTSVLLVKIET